MVVLNIYLDNIFLFRDFNLCLSYPKKIVNSTIENEYLQGRENFRYRKLVVLMGANATGKTALGKSLMHIFNFISKKEAASLFKLIDNKMQPASFSIDFAFPDFTLYRISATIQPKKNINDEYSSDDVSVTVKHENIRAYDSYETCAKRLEDSPKQIEGHYIQALEKVPFLTWGFEYPFASEGKLRAVHPLNVNLYTKVLKNALQSMDPRIVNVTRVKDTDNTYLIKYPNHDVLIKDGVVIDKEMLSSGTNEIIGVAQMISDMKLSAESFYYCDEKFSHVHSEMEKAYLSVMIDLLKPNQQLFFTTHNLDILKMKLPKHSFAFLRRDQYEGNTVSCVFASDYLKKSTDSVLNAVENDLFTSAPLTENTLRLAESF